MPYLNDIVLDAGVDHLIANGKELHLLTALPTSYAAVLADTVGKQVAPTITKVDNAGVGGGRSAQIAATAITIDTATNHASADQSVVNYAVIDTTNSVLLAAGDITAKTFSNGDTANVPVLNINFLDATSI